MNISLHLPFSHREGLHRNTYRQTAWRGAALLVLALGFSFKAQGATPPGSTAVLTWPYKDLNASSYANYLPADITTNSDLKGMTVTQLAFGSEQAVALCSDGSLVTARRGGSPVFTPAILANKKVVQIAAGYQHFLALCSDGTVVTWGNDNHGQLGQGNTIGSYNPNITNNGALNGKTVIQVAAGYYHSLALCSDGSIAVWGYNEYGQCGNAGPDVFLPTPFQHNGTLSGKKVVQLISCLNHCFALCSDGTIVSWGWNCNAQTGFPDTYSPYLHWQPPLVLSNRGALQGKRVTQLVTGDFHGLALCSDGTVAAWGNNNYGQLGTGGVSQSIPVSITDKGVLKGKRVVKLGVGYETSFALCSDGTVAAWGWNAKGEVGDGGQTDQPLPLSINNKGDLAHKKVSSIGGGYEYSMALATVLTDQEEKPVVAISTPFAGQNVPINAFNGNIISGIASDNQKVASVDLRLYRTRGGIVQVWDGTAFTSAATTVPSTLTGSTTDVTWKMGTKAPLQSQLDLGPYYVWAYATDGAGNTVSARTNFTIVASDTQKPTVSISTPIANQVIYRGSINRFVINGSATDNNSIASVRLKLYRTRNGVIETWNGTSFSSSFQGTIPAILSGSNSSVTWDMGAQSPTQGTFDEGSYSLIAEAYDIAGNHTPARLSFTITTTPQASDSTPIGSASRS